MITIERDSQLGRALWGAMPLPQGAEYIGTVVRDGETGALLLMPTGRYVQGNAGALRSLPQRDVRTALAEAPSLNAAFGARGGSAGTGESKRRGDADYYRALSAKAGSKRGRPKIKHD